MDCKNPKQFSSIFKYGPGLNSNRFSGVKNILGRTQDLENTRKSILKDLSPSLNNIIRRQINDDFLPELEQSNITTINETVNNLVNTTINNNPIINSISSQINNKIDNKISNISNNIINNSEILGSNDINIDTSTWCIDNNFNTYTFSNVGINSSNSKNYNLFVNGETYSNNILVNDSIFFNNKSNRLHVKNNHIYFNNCQLDKCNKDELILYTDLDM